jgi:hypothetical protein
VVQELMDSGKILGALNTTFIALIPKKQDVDTFKDFRPISLCNLIYKVISKTIANRLKGIMSGIISEEQFGFLNNRQIHDVMSIAQEGIHSMSISKNPRVVLKIDLAKSYDKVNWTYLRLLLLQMGMKVQSVNWIMGCVESISFVVLINGSPSRFFRATRGLW